MPRSVIKNIDKVIRQVLADNGITMEDDDNV